MSDFTNEELVSFEIDGKNFKYKPITGGDELDWVSECLKVEGDKVTRDSRQTALCKLRNIKEVPYTIEEIKQAIGIEKSYADLDDKDKDKLWSKVKGTVLNQILLKIQEIESPNAEIKKN